MSHYEYPEYPDIYLTEKEHHLLHIIKDESYEKGYCDLTLSDYTKRLHVSKEVCKSILKKLASPLWRFGDKPLIEKKRIFPLKKGQGNKIIPLV